MQKSIFIFHNVSKQVPNCLIANIPLGVKSKNELLEVFSEQLSFPDYFGKNWDALYDCLCDLKWISNKTIRIIHSDIPTLDNISIYLDILKDAVLYWQTDDLHNLEVVFPRFYKSRVYKSFE